MLPPSSPSALGITSLSLGDEQCTTLWYTDEWRLQNQVLCEFLTNFFIISDMKILFFSGFPMACFYQIPVCPSFTWDFRDSKTGKERGKAVLRAGEIKGLKELFSQASLAFSFLFSPLFCFQESPMWSPSYCPWSGSARKRVDKREGKWTGRPLTVPLLEAEEEVTVRGHEIVAVSGETAVSSVMGF